MQIGGWGRFTFTKIHLFGLLTWEGSLSDKLCSTATVLEKGEVYVLIMIMQSNILRPSHNCTLSFKTILDTARLSCIYFNLF